MKPNWKSLVAVVPFLVAVGCVDPAKAPAEAVIKAGEAAVANITAEVEKLAPEQSKAAKDKLAAAKAAAAKEDWKGAQAAGKDVAMTAAEAVEAAKAKKAAIEAAAAAKVAELKAAWESAAKEIPAKLEAVKKQIAKLAKSKKLPKGVTKDTIKKAKGDVAVLQAEFAKLSETAKTDVQAAGTAAKDLMAKVAQLAAAVGI